MEKRMKRQGMVDQYDWLDRKRTREGLVRGSDVKIGPHYVSSMYYACSFSNI